MSNCEQIVLGLAVASLCFAFILIVVKVIIPHGKQLEDKVKTREEKAKEAMLTSLTADEVRASAEYKYNEVVYAKTLAYRRRVFQYISDSANRGLFEVSIRCSDFMYGAVDVFNERVRKYLEDRGFTVSKQLTRKLKRTYPYSIHESRWEEVECWSISWKGNESK